MKREDVLAVDQVKEELSAGMNQMNATLRSVFGQLVYALDTVLEHYNDLEIKYTALRTEHDQLAARFDQVSARLLAIERRLGAH